MAYVLNIYDHPEDFTKPKYELLLKTCFSYSAFFSLTYAFPWDPDGEEKQVDWDTEALQPFLFKDYFTDDEWWYTEGRSAHIRIYHAVPQAIPLLLDYAPMGMGLSGERYPEDITFFRADGSVLFGSISHEGECWIEARAGEDIRSLLAAVEHEPTCDESDWIPSIWTAKRIAPQQIPPAQQDFLEGVEKANRKEKQARANFREHYLADKQRVTQN